MRCTPLTVAIPLLVVALVCAGCGGSDRPEYERGLAKVGRSVDRALAKLPTDATSSPGPDQIATLANDLEASADDLDDLSTPEDAKAPERKLERGLRGVATAFAGLATDLRGAQTDVAKAELFVSFATDADIDRAFEDLSSAQEDYAKVGYRVFDTKIEQPAAAKG